MHKSFPDELRDAAESTNDCVADDMLRCAANEIERLQADIPTPAPWAGVPIDAHFLAEVFDAFAGADAYNLVAKMAIERLKREPVERLLSTYDDCALIEECLKRISKNGNLILSREVFVGGFRHDPAPYMLEPTGIPITQPKTIF